MKNNFFYVLKGILKTLLLILLLGIVITIICGAVFGSSGFDIGIESSMGIIPLLIADKTNLFLFLLGILWFVGLVILLRNYEVRYLRRIIFIAVISWFLIGLIFKLSGFFNQPGAFSFLY